MGIEVLAGVLRRQDGVISHAQVLAAGSPPPDLRRLRRPRLLVRVHPRVYVDHTGRLPWPQRAWAAVLWAEPAALCHRSAVQIGAGKGSPSLRDAETVHVAVAHSRHLPGQAGIQVHRMRDFEARVQALGPPRIRLEEALIDLAAEARTDTAAIAELADACGAGRTTGERLLECARARPQLRRRTLIESVLADVATGSCSALEQAYLDNVVRPHGLPEGRRQASHRHAGTSLYRDVLLERERVCVELDGRLTHGEWGDRDRDLDRDLDAVAEEELLTVRLSWGQCTARACATAGKLGAVLARRGRAEQITACPACRLAA